MNKWNRLQRQLLPGPGQGWIGPGTWRICSHPNTLCIKKQQSILNVIRERRYLHLQGQKNYLGKTLLCSWFFLGSLLLTSTFRFLPGRLITVTATATQHRWIHKWRTLSPHKIKTTCEDVCKTEGCCGAFSSEQSFPSPLHPNPTNNTFGEGKKPTSLKC